MISLKFFRVSVCILLAALLQTTVSAQVPSLTTNQQMVSFGPGSGHFPLITGNETAQLYVEEAVNAGVKRTLEDF